MSIRVWGLTGLIGSGKSLALEMLKRKGCPAIDADEVSRWVVDPSRDEGTEGLSRVRLAFGEEVFLADGSIDRAKLRLVIAGDNVQRNRLEQILHPLILGRVEKEIRGWEAQGFSLGVIEGTRLIEAGYLSRLAGLIVVTSDAARRLERVRARDGMADRDIEALGALQDGELMLAKARLVWINDAEPSVLEAQVDAFLATEIPHF